MPLYEYECGDCGKPFEALVTASRTPACPACNGTNLAKLPSSPGRVGVSAGRTDSPSAAAPGRSCGAGTCGCAN